MREQGALWYVGRAGCIANRSDVIRSWKSQFNTVLFALFNTISDMLGDFLQMCGERDVISAMYRVAFILRFSPTQRRPSGWEGGASPSMELMTFSLGNCSCALALLGVVALADWQI